MKVEDRKNSCRDLIVWQKSTELAKAFGYIGNYKDILNLSVEIEKMINALISKKRENYAK